MTQEELMGRLRAVAEHLNAIQASGLAIDIPGSGCTDLAFQVFKELTTIAEVAQDLNGVWRAESYRGGG